MSEMGDTAGITGALNTGAADLLGINVVVAEAEVVTEVVAVSGVKETEILATTGKSVEEISVTLVLVATILESGLEAVNSIGFPIEINGSSCGNSNGPVPANCVNICILRWIVP